MIDCSLATLCSGTITVGARQIARLRQRLEGRLLFPDHADFAEATRLWNGMVDKRPALVVQPADAADVRRVLGFAAEYDLLLSVRGGGHNIAGSSLVHGGITLDMSRLRQLTVDPKQRSADVGAGCQLWEMDRATQAHGLATPLGYFSPVGVAGLTLGGGFGYLTRRFGWTVDNLLGVEIVTADGQVRRASRQQQPDLFWAVRGAGANFGVVTRFQFGLHPVGPQVFGGLVAWPFERVDAVLEAYRRLTGRAPRELAAFLVLLRAPAEPPVPQAWHGRRLCALSLCFSGDPRHVERVLEPVRALGPPVLDLLQARPYTELQSYLDPVEPAGRHYYWKSEYAAKLDERLLWLCRDLIEECPIPGAKLYFAHLAGQLNEHASDDGSVGNRDAQFAYGLAGSWAPGTPAAGAYQRWVRGAWRRFRRFSTGGSYVNFQTADEDESRVRAAYGTNFERLVSLKRRYDPDNRFRSNRNIAGSPTSREKT